MADVDEGVRVEMKRSRRGKFSVPIKFDVESNRVGDPPAGLLFDICAKGSANWNVERIIETEQVTNAESRPSSLPS